MNRILNIVCVVCLTTIIQIKLYGQNWIDISPHFDYPDSSRYHYDGCFINVNEGWFKKSFPGTLWHTTDGELPGKNKSTAMITGLVIYNLLMRIMDGLLAKHI